MKRIAGILYAAMLCAAASAHDITGRVIDSQTGKPIQRARVTVAIADRQTEPPDPVALTDEEGRFTVLNFTQSAAWLTVEKPGYLGGSGRKESSLRWTEGLAEPIVFSLVRQAVIDVRIVDETGNRVKALVILLRKNPLTGSIDTVSNGSNGGSPDDEFRFFGLEGGTYFAQVGSFTNAGPAMYPPMFYPRASTFDEAKPIFLQSGQEEHLEFKVSEVPSYKVRGHFAGSNNASLTLRLPGPPTGSNIGNMNLDEKSQSFEISYVPSGTYLLEMSGWSDNKQLKATETITVRNRDLDGVIVNLMPVDPPPLLRPTQFVSSR